MRDCYIIRCSCGKVIMQCNCTRGNLKPVRTIERGCKDCKHGINNK